MGTYSGKNVVITGGGSGIGFAMAQLLVDGGATVVITGRAQTTLDAAVDQLGPGAHAIRGDVSSVSELEVLAGRLKRDIGTVDALFVNAGIAPTTPFESTTEEAYDDEASHRVLGDPFRLELRSLLAVHHTFEDARVYGNRRCRDASYFHRAITGVRATGVGPVGPAGPAREGALGQWAQPTAGRRGGSSDSEAAPSGAPLACGHL